jgi:hypothetical protein
MSSIHLDFFLLSLGNLARIPSIIEKLIDLHTEETFLVLLQHNNPQVLGAVIGIFINLSANSFGRVKLLHQHYYSRLLKQVIILLKKLSFNDFNLAILLCQVRPCVGFLLSFFLSFLV